jgi:acyl carrier protein
MNIKKKLTEVVQEVFRIKNFNLKKMALGTHQKWDSVGHLNLMLAIEKKFKIKFKMNQIIDLDSFLKIQKEISKILKKK